MPFRQHGQQTGSRSNVEGSEDGTTILLVGSMFQNQESPYRLLGSSFDRFLVEIVPSLVVEHGKHPFFGVDVGNNACSFHNSILLGMLDVTRRRRRSSSSVFPFHSPILAIESRNQDHGRCFAAVAAAAAVAITIVILDVHPHRLVPFCLGERRQDLLVHADVIVVLF